MLEKKGRLSNTILNSFWATASQLIVVLLGLFSRKVFLNNLGAELLGVNSLFSDVLILFSFADLGFGTAIMFSMYKPIANSDTIKIKSFLLFYKKIYNYVIISISVISLLFIPFLTEIKTDIPIDDLTIYYIIFQLNNIIQYVWAYRENYVIASQNERLLSAINIIYSILSTIVLLTSVIIYKNFLIYLIISFVCILLKKILVNVYIVHKYPITRLENASELAKDEKRGVVSKSMALFVTKIGNLMINQTDSLIVSYAINVIQWGYASNYLVLKRSVFVITDKIYGAILPSMGNLVAEGNREKELQVFFKYDFINAWIHTFFFISLSCLSSPFIDLFFGKGMTLSNTFVFVFFFSAFLDGLRSPVSMLREATGTYEEDKWYTILAAIINLIVSIPLANIFGLSGVFIGTIIAMVTLHICRTIILFKKDTYTISANHYLYKIFIHVIVGLLLLCATRLVCNYFHSSISNDLVSFICMIFTICILPNFIWIIIYRNNDIIESIIKHLKTKII